MRHVTVAALLLLTAVACSPASHRKLGSESSTGGTTGGTTGSPTLATGGGTGFSTLPATTGSDTTGTTAAGGGSGGGSAVTPAADDLLLQLKLDDGAWTNGSRITDSSSYARDVYVASDGLSSGTRPTTAASSRCLAFPSGGAAHLTTADAPTLHPTTALTMAAWIHPKNLTAASSMGIISKRNGYGTSTDFAMHLWTDDGNLGAASQLCVDVDGTESRSFSTTVIRSDTWYHVAAVFDGTAPQAERLRLYVNGALDSVHADQATSITAHADALEIGNLPNGGGHFVGYLDEAMIWSRALSASEVAELYQSQK